MTGGRGAPRLSTKIPLPTGLLLLICAGLFFWSSRAGAMPTSKVSAILALVSSVFLELQATPLAIGYFSPAPGWAIALTGLKGVGLPWVLACTGCAIATRVMIFPPSPNGPVADFVVDFLPAAVAASAVAKLGLVHGLPIYLAAALPIPLVLSAWLAPHTNAGKARKSLVLEHFAMVGLGPTAVLLAGIHPVLLVLVWPSLFSLLRASYTGAELQQRRSQHTALRQAKSEITLQEKKVSESEQRQIKLRQLLDARADTFALLETLSARPLGEREALEEALQALRLRLPGADCLFVPADGNGPELAGASPELGLGLKRAWRDQQPWMTATREQIQAAWPLAQRGLVLIQGPIPLSYELQHTLGVFFHYLNVMLERVRFQENILVALHTEATLRKELTMAVTRLQALLGGASELASLVQPREILELLVDRASAWTGGRPCRASHGGMLVGPAVIAPLVLPLAGGEFSIHSDGLEAAEVEALRLWAVLGAGALERCRAQASLVHGSKLAAIGQLAAGVAHELNTPLGSISMALGLAIQNLETKPERARSRLEIARKAVDQMRTIVSKLLNYSRETGAGRKVVSLAEVVQDSVQLVDQSFQLEGVELAVHLEEVLVEINPGEIQQVLINLLVNARQSLAGTEQARVQISIRPVPDGVVVEVSDNGPGVPQESLDRIFEPFFTTREMGQGVGLGLSISREIVTAHGGELRHQPSPQGGACFVVELPVCQE